MKRLKLLYLLVSLLSIVWDAEVQVDTPQVARPRIQMSTSAALSVAGDIGLLAPTISYGAARGFEAGQQVDWSPTNSGGPALFGVTLEQTLTGYFNVLNTAVAPDNTLYIANAGVHSIVKRTPAGSESVFAGGNSTSYGYADGAGSSARFRHPSFVALDAAGNLYVSDQQNHRIRKITPAGLVSTFAGSGTAGSSDGTGTAASFQYPMGLAFDVSGNLYVADAYNHRIRRITPTGVVTTYAGNGVAGLSNGTLATASFNYPIGLSFDSNGDLYVADRSNFAVRRIAGNIVTTVAGNGTTGNVDGSGAAARFQANGLVADGGNIYFVDQTYNGLKYISPSGQVVTLSSSGLYTGPFGISKGPDGKFYITENSLGQIKKVVITPAYKITPALPAGLFFDAYTGRITGKIGTVPLQQSYTVTSRNPGGVSTATVTFVAGGSSVLVSADQNYIITRTPRKAGYTSAAAAEGKPVADVNVNIQYLDGLGRGMQDVQWQGSPLKQDIVQHIEYDNFGRESKKYLPHVKNIIKDGSFKPTAKADQQAYYAETNTWDLAVAKTSFPYAVTVFENSPLSRLQQQGAPGAAWQPPADRNLVTATTGAGRTAVTEYSTNSKNDVKLWTLDAAGNGAKATFYIAGKLRKTITKNENWVKASGRAGTVEQYKDFEDRIVLRRVWNINPTTKAEYALETHYIYDDFGNLCYVVPPAVTAASFTEAAADPNFDAYIYAYKYDSRKRVIEKKIPGKGWEYLVYNKNDQVILTQNAVQRGQSKWSYTKYDPFGRLASTGIYTNETAGQTTRAQVQTLADAAAQQMESRIGTAAYTNVTFPNIAAQLLELTVNYYDDYKFKTATVLPATTGIDSTWMVKGMLTGSKVSKDDGTSPLFSVNYYDKYGRIIESVSDNHLAGVDRVTNTYNFSGELVTSKLQHRISGSTAVTTILTTNDYDHVGRLVQTKKKVNSQAEVIQSRLAYNEIGQLKSKSLHSENGGTNFATNIAYGYNERGWQTKASTPFFSYQLNYNVNGTTVLTNAQYNGNIAQQVWNHSNTGGVLVSNTFNYGYDALDRLSSGVATGMKEVLSYDDMGNIRTLTRDDQTAITYGYNNTNRSNKLASLSGGLTGSFTYDLNGNATKDRTGMALTYNYLDLPSTAVLGGRTVAYSYDAMGSKLSRKSTVNGIAAEYNYINGVQYSKVGAGATVIDRIATEEGFLLNNAGTYGYYYNVADHLGNVRVVFRKDGTAAAPVAGVMQRQDYYPFGKTKTIATALDNKYLYNGKEMQSDLNLGTHTLGSSYVLEGQYDYGARFYDAEIGRWNAVDPMAEAFDNVSPYVYGMNNPILMIDPNGMAADTTFWGGVLETVNVVGNKLDNFRWPTWTYHIPVIGSAAQSGNNLADGRYGLAAINFGTSLAELFTAGYLSEYRLGTKMMSTAADDVLVSGLKFRQGVKEAFKKHALANGRHNDLGVSGETLVENAFKLIESNKAILKPGDNTLIGTINGVQKSLKAFVKDGEILSVNMYHGVSNRITDGGVIKFGEIIWK